MRQRDVQAVAIATRAAHSLGQRDAAPVALDRELPHEEHDLGPQERELFLEPGDAERDLRR